MAETEEKKEKKKSPVVMATAFLGALATVITAIAALLGSMNVGDRVDEDKKANDLMMKLMVGYTDKRVGELQVQIAELKGSVSILRQVCTDQDGDAIKEDKPAMGGGGGGGAPIGIGGSAHIVSSPGCASGADCPEGDICVDGECSDPDEPMSEPPPPKPEARPRPAPPPTNDAYRQMQQQVQEQIQLWRD